MKGVGHPLSTSWGVVALERYGERDDSLRAWDAADEYLLEELFEHRQDWLPPNARVLVFNDQWGALCITLDKYGQHHGVSVVDLVALTDSWVANAALEANRNLNQLSPKPAVYTPNCPAGPFDLVLYKLPKNMAYFEDMLGQLCQQLAPRAWVVGAAMVKHMPGSAITIATSLVGDTHTSLAWKKARLIISRNTASSSFKRAVSLSTYDVKEYGLTLSSYSNVFSRQKLDIGTRVLLPLIPDLTRATPKTQPRVAPVILDLACGNGVVGLVAAKRNPGARLILTDESAMAIESAKLNFARNLPAQAVQFLHTDALQGIEPNSLDLVLCNPPFHEQHQVGDRIALRMFKQARQALKPRGSMLVVGNRHLGYHLMLKKLFGQAAVVASHPKFVVLQVEKP